MKTDDADGSQRVLLVDDHAVVRAGYRRLLEQSRPSLDVHEAATGEEAYRLTTRLNFSLVILDLSLPGAGGLETLRRMRRRHPNLSVLVVSIHDQPAFVEQALAAGASGYATKASAAETLVQAVADVLQGRRYLGSEIASAPSADNEGAGFRRLSPREFEVFRLLAAGVRLSVIAQRLCISYKTAANHATAVRGKLRVGSTSDMTRLAIRTGVIDP